MCSICGWVFSRYSQGRVVVVVVVVSLFDWAGWIFAAISWCAPAILWQRTATTPYILWLSQQLLFVITLLSNRSRRTNGKEAVLVFFVVFVIQYDTIQYNLYYLCALMAQINHSGFTLLAKWRVFAPPLCYGLKQWQNGSLKTSSLNMI